MTFQLRSAFILLQKGALQKNTSFQIEILPEAKYFRNFNVIHVLSGTLKEIGVQTTKKYFTQTDVNITLNR